MRRTTFIAAICFTLLLLLPSQALARGGSYVFDGGTPAQQGQVRAALGASSFDWSVLPARIHVHIRPGVATSAAKGHVWIDADMLGAGQFAWAPIQDEFAHQVDFFLFDDATRAHLTDVLGGRDWCYGVRGLAHHEYGCERFASTLVWAYWPSKNNAYRPASPTDESAALPPAQFRSLVTGLLSGRALSAFARP